MPISQGTSSDDTKGVLAPAVIDIAPYWRPVEFSEPVVVSDGLTDYGQGIKLIELYGTDELRLQVLVRALYWRMLTFAIQSDLPWIEKHMRTMDFENTVKLVTVVRREEKSCLHNIMKNGMHYGYKRMSYAVTNQLIINFYSRTVYVALHSPTIVNFLCLQFLPRAVAHPQDNKQSHVLIIMSILITHLGSIRPAPRPPKHDIVRCHIHDICSRAGLQHR